MEPEIFRELTVFVWNEWDDALAERFFLQMPRGMRRASRQNRRSR
ncbi:hypothetical protein [Paraburkholderia humisilvae]